MRRYLVRKWLLSIAIVSVLLVLFGVPNSSRAAAGINQQMNFQARLLTSAGAVVADGTYNLEFKIVQDGDGCNPTSGTFPCSGTVVWTETRIQTNRVTVKNGYFSVSLGSVTALPTTIWNQDTLWLSINVGGTANTPTPTWDGEMKPLKRLSSSPYALNSGQLGGLTSGNFVQLAQGLQADSSNTNTSVAINKTGSAAILQLQQAGADVLTLDNAGSLAVTYRGTAGALSVDTTNSTADGVSIDIAGSSTSEYAFKVTSNNGATNGLYVRADGKVGIATTTPANTLTVDGTANITGYVALGEGTINPTWYGNPSAMSLNIVRTSSNQATTQNVGIRTHIIVNPTADQIPFLPNWGTVQEVEMMAGNDKDVWELTGNTSRISHYGTGNVYYGGGQEGKVFNLSTGSMTNAIPGWFGYFNMGGGSITNGYGVLIESADNLSGTVTNNYGLYIKDQSAVGSTDSYNIYSAGASSKNYFAGSVGVGDPTPASLLSVGNGDLFQVDSSGNTSLDNQADLRLLEADANGSNYVAIQAPSSITSNATLTWNALSQCSGTNGGALTINGSSEIICSDDDGGGSSTTLQQAYDNDLSTDDAVIALDSTGSLIFRNPASSGTASAYLLTVDQLSTGSTGGLFVNSLGADANFALRVDDSSSDTTPFVIDNTGNAGIGTTSPGAKLQVNGGSSAIGAIIRANATTPGNFLELQNSSGTALSYFDNTGTFNMPQVIGTPVQVFSSQSTASGRGPFSLTVGDTLFNSTRDVVGYFGYNASNGGGRYNASDHSFAWVHESDYEVGPGTHWAESYTEYRNKSGGGAFRPWFFVIDKDTDIIQEHSFSGSPFVFKTQTGTQLAQLASDGLQIVGGAGIDPVLQLQAAAGRTPQVIGLSGAVPRFAIQGNADYQAAIYVNSGRVMTWQYIGTQAVVSINSDEPVGNLFIKGSHVDTNVLALAPFSSSQNAPLLRLYNFDRSVDFGGFNRNGYLSDKKNAAPTDGELATSELASWYDNTVGATRAMFKAKDSAGTVVAGGLPLGYTSGDLLYASSTSALSKLAIGSNGNCLTVSSSLPAWGSCSGGSTTWNSIIAPTAALSMNMYQTVGTSFATTFTYGNATSTTNLFNLTDTASNSGTGYLLNLTTQSGSTLKPLHVSAAGVEALTVLADGTVGIGTAAPTGKLTILTANTASTLTGANSSLYIDNSSGSGQSLVTFGMSGSPVGGVRADFQGNFNWHATGSQGHQFYSTLDTSGPILGMSASGLQIGGAAGATSAAKLNVNGNAAIGYAVTQAAPSNGLIVSGNVGIGTNDPQNKLQINSSGANTDVARIIASDSQSIFEFTEGSTGQGYMDIMDTTGNIDIRLNTAADSWFNGGNVGIGDVDPLALFTVGSGDKFQVASGGGLTFNGVTTDITTSAAEALTLTAGTTGDVIVSGDADTNFQVSFTAAPGVDMATISNSGQGVATTSGVDGLAITYVQAADATNITGSGLDISVTQSGDAGDTIRGLTINNITNGNSTEYALVIGTGWDRGLDVNSHAQVNSTLTATGTTIIGSSGNTFTFNPASGPVYAGTARPSKVLVLSPEYPGATLSTDGSSTTSGSLTSDNELNATSAKEWKNYYKWTSTQASNQDYTVMVRVTLPQDFDSWETGSCPGSTCGLELSFATGLNATTNNAVSMLVNNATDTPGTAVCTVSDSASATNDVWTSFGCTEATLNDGSSSEWDAAGETAILRIKMKANSTASAQSKVGDITLRYKAKF